MMRFDILTIFPEIFSPYLDASILGQSRAKGLIEVAVHNIRDFASDQHNTVDDTPYGGGPGMVLKVEPIAHTIDSINDRFPVANLQKRRTVVLSARGEMFNQRKAEEYALLDKLTLICGRYEGIDQRVADHLADEELSIGPYVLNGGEAAAMVVLETVARLVPGVVGNPESLVEESFSGLRESPTSPRKEPSDSSGLRGVPALQAEYPQYTKPAEYQGWKVPKVLLSGNHAAIKKWREQQSKTPNKGR